MREVVIAGAARTPMGGFQGVFAELDAPTLGGAAIEAALKDAGISPARVEEVLMGNVLSAGQGQAPARQAGFKAGLGEDVPATTLNKMCGSGMQALMQHSEENGGADALGIFAGTVKRFPEVAGLKVPHMGWNQVHQRDPSHPMWNNIEQDARFYFVHSFYVEPQDEKIVAATCDYGLTFCTALHQDNLFATQFHPEKSHTVGLQLLKNFVEWNI